MTNSPPQLVLPPNSQRQLPLMRTSIGQKLSQPPWHLKHRKLVLVSDLKRQFMGIQNAFYGLRWWNNTFALFLFYYYPSEKRRYKAYRYRPFSVDKRDLKSVSERYSGHTRSTLCCWKQSRLNHISIWPKRLRNIFNFCRELQRTGSKKHVCWRLYA